MDDEGTSGTVLSPDDAFAAVGNETRIEILRELGGADGPFAFSELYDRVDVDDSAQFNYHLDKLVGHFVQKSEDGYALKRPGKYLVEAILSGAVTEDPQIDRTQVDDPCHNCGTRLEIQWREGSIELFCPDCESRWDRSYGRAGEPETVDSGYLGRYPFPPAGLRNRTPSEILSAAYTWSTLELLAVASGLCPRCSATVDLQASICEDHEDGEGTCSNCGTQYAIRAVASCTNCTYSMGSAGIPGVLSNGAVLAFLLDHGLNPIVPESVHHVETFVNGYDEEILTTEPFEGAFRLEVDGDVLELRVDEELGVLETTRRSGNQV